MSKGSIATIAARPPDYDSATLRRLLREEYGIAGEIRALVSERDQNLSVRTANGEHFVLKITSAAEDPKATQCQVAVLLHLAEAALEFCVPQIQATRSGAPTTTLDTHPVRLVRYVPGNLLSNASPGAELAARFGGRLAQLGAALRDFQGPDSGQRLLWDMRRAAELRDIVGYIDDASTQALVAQVLDEFESLAVPAFETLRQQVIHNDANPANVLTDTSANDVIGFIDFGDMIKAPLVIDVAVAAAYLRADASDELQLLAPFVRGYTGVTPLDECEIDLLYTLVCTRLATTIAILHWRLADREPSDPYRQQSLDREADAGAFLRVLRQMGRGAFTRRLFDG